MRVQHMWRLMPFIPTVSAASLFIVMLMDIGSEFWIDWYCIKNK